MTGIVTRAGKSRHVKNLGWLLRHADEVERFTISPASPLTSTREGVGGVKMTAHLSDGGSFQITWASASVLRDWLKRPSFHGTPVQWEGFTTD